MPISSLSIQFKPPCGRTFRVAGDAPIAEVVQDWLGALGPNHIPLLLQAATQQVALSSEWVTIIYDTEREPDVEPFEGVAMLPDYRDARVVLSRGEFDQLWLRVLVAIETAAPEPTPNWWGQLGEALAAVRARVLTARS